MSETMCGVCAVAARKYKCPTCALPYCSLTCFKTHKLTHPEDVSVPSAPAPAPAPDLPTPSVPPETIPKYLRTKTDFSRLATDPQFRDMLKSRPTLLPVLQRIYAATLEPEPGDEPQRGMRGRGGGRGNWRGRGARGRWRGDDRPKWTPKRGDQDAIRMLKGLREGKRGDTEKDDIGEFVAMVEAMFGEKDKRMDVDS